MIPLLDLSQVNAPFARSIKAAMERVLNSGWYILGQEVERFESAWASYCGAGYCVGTGNALDALRLLLMAYGIGPGDEVIVPSNTYIATWLSVTHVGAKPVPVEPEERTFNIDPARIEEAITPRTRAIVAVHLYGRPAPMGALMDVARRRGLFLFEDAAQAHGATGIACADGAAFSFYPTKNLGGLGDGGAVVTDSHTIAQRIRRLRNYGGVGRLDHQVIGINSRLDELQAAIITTKMIHLSAMNNARRTRAGYYLKALAGTPLTLPEWDRASVWHQFVVRSKDRDQVVERARVAGALDLHVHYPIPPHMEGAYAGMYAPGSYPIAERLGNEVFSLPIGFDVDVEEVCRRLRRAL